MASKSELDVEIGAISRQDANITDTNTDTTILDTKADLVQTKS